MPQWIPSRIRSKIVPWRTDKKETKSYLNDFESLLTFDGLACFTLNADAISDRRSKGGGPKVKSSVKMFMHRFIEARNVFLIIDECDWASSPTSARSETILRVSRRPNVKAVRILSMTIGADSPFEYFLPYSLLAPPTEVFGLKDFQAFRHRYGKFQEGMVPQVEYGWDPKLKRVAPKWDPQTGDWEYVRDARGEIVRKWGVVKASNFRTRSLYELQDHDDEGRPLFRDLDDLKARLDPWRMVVKRSDVSDAPEKVYDPCVYEMSAEQRRVYDQLANEYVAELQDLSTIDGAHVLTRWLRLQQVLGNHLPGFEGGVVCEGCDGDGCIACDDVGVVAHSFPTRRVDLKHDPRLDALIARMERQRVPTIVWSRFTPEVDAIVTRLMDSGTPVVRFDGHVSSDVRMEGLRAFQAGEVDVLVGNQDTGGRGLRMSRAGLMVFYSNTFNRKTREQAEDRGEAIGKMEPTTIVDMVCEGTIDETIADAHRYKRDLKRIVTGPGWRERMK